MQKQNKFNWRSFIAIYMFFSISVMIISGIILYISPPDRIANWTDWSFFGLSKNQWEALHILFSLIWVGFVAYHIFFNRKVFFNYLSEKIKSKLHLRKEFFVAFTLTIIVLLGTLFDIPPFGTVIKLSNYATNSWITKSNEPPVPNAENLSLHQLSDLVHLSYDETLSLLRTNNIQIKDTSFTLSNIAKANNISPFQIYLLLTVEKEFVEKSKLKTH